jgi:hypothetical protein
MSEFHNPSLPLRIGCGAGFSGDRTDAASPVVHDLVDGLRTMGGSAVLIFETLAERTLALAQLARVADPLAGYEPLLLAYLRPVLANCLLHGIRIVSNFGAANPVAAAQAIAELAHSLNLRAPRIGVVSGDDVRSHPEVLSLARSLPRPVVSANAYLGAQAIAQALNAGADIVVCGRVADPSLTLGPALAHFGWALDDWDALAGATMAGHLLECGAQVTGGYYADPGFKDLPDLAHVGFPIARIEADGSCTLSKPAGTGGRIDSHTVKEQLLYEIDNPAAYMTPDVVADITAARVTEMGPDCVRLSGVQGHPRPTHLKVNLCHENGWFAEGEISYAGPRAEGRARLAADILRERLPLLKLRVDLIGVSSIWADDAGAVQAALPDAGHTDVRLRIAASHEDKAVAEQLLREVNALYSCGPAGGGGVRTGLRPRLGLVSCLLPQASVSSRFDMWQSAAIGETV